MDKKNKVVASAIATAIVILSTATEVGGSRSNQATSAGISVAAAGDICAYTSALASRCAQTADLIQSRNPNHVFTLGDAQYPDGSLSRFKTWYQPRWGAFKAKTYPTTGNHDTFGSGYSNYFDGAAPGTTIRRHYERDLGAWRVVSVDSNSILGARNFVQVFLSRPITGYSYGITIHMHRRQIMTTSQTGDRSTRTQWRRVRT
jgi:hypothetical protein